MLQVETIKRYQSRMACKVVAHDVVDVESIRYAVGVDVAYKGDMAFAAAVMVDRLDGKIVYESNSISRVYIPYIPGLLFLREGAPMLSALRSLIKYVYGRSCIGCIDDCIVIVDGNGMLHPRLFGLACYIGILIDIPTVGVSKSLLCGTIISKSSDGSVMLNGREVARVVEYNGKRIYVSIGHKISLDSAEGIVRSLIHYGEEAAAEGVRARARKSKSIPLSSSSLPSSLPLPEPLRLAHNAANALRRSQALH
ncbi:MULTISPECIES: endonuclease V [Candidatus Nitrosocaldus]|jgi:deoxyribonuclease V|uniref:Endonuclease V n=1 Tax=Candidatus Nitrosocaldus cavascurensis TaxID=2058097 RepID=A0A2K5APH4_9ARCH|nr:MULTISPECIES: endonuclease V [Candidatus Nitrosocaldus]SPC33517.1 Endonuclease V (modular protein) [Candidatus Nitrosocaldus cavascurensis]